MTFGKSTWMAGAAACAVLLPGVALAQTPPAAAPAAGQPATALTQGATVYDTSGGTVGTIESISGDYAVVATTNSKVRLPKSSFAMTGKGPELAMTAAQLDAAAAQAAPTQQKANVVAGAQVVDTQGGAVGTIADVGPQFATIQLTTGSKVRLPITAFGAGANGGLRIAMTAAQLTAAAGASGAAAGAASTPSMGNASSASGTPSNSSDGGR